MFEVSSQNVEAENFDTYQNIIDPSRILLPPMSKWLERTIVLDLDNTLVNATLSRPPKYDFTISVQHNGEKTLTYYVQQRFGINLLFFYLKIYKYEIIIFTSASKEYTDAILKEFNMDGVVDHCLYKDSCSSVLGRCVKDLTKLGRDMKKIFMVDDCPDCYQLQPENGFLVKPFLSSSHDRELIRVVDVARRGAQCEDVREALIRCSEIARVTAGKQERENVTLREQESEASKKVDDMAQPRDREREIPEVGVCGNQPKAKVKKYSIFGFGRCQAKELASNNSKNSNNIAKCKEKIGVILKAAGKRVQRREQQRRARHDDLDKPQRGEPKRRLPNVGIVEIHPQQLNKRTSNMDPNKVQPERGNSNSGVSNVEEPLQVERSSSPSLGKGRSKEPPKETSNVGIQRKEPLRGTSDTAVQCRQLEKKAFSAEFDRVQPDDLERGRSEVHVNRTSAVEMKACHVDFVVYNDYLQSIESKRDNMNFLEQETSQGSQSMDIVMSEKSNSETSKTSLEGDNMNIFKQVTSRGGQNMDMATLKKLHSEISKISLDGFKPSKQEPNADIDGPDGFYYHKFQHSGEDDYKASNDTFQPREDKLEYSSSTPDVSHDNIQSTESKVSGTYKDSSYTLCSKDLEKGNCIDGVGMLNHNEPEEKTSNVSIHSFQTSDSEAEENSNISVDSFETSDSEVQRFEPSNSKVAEICTESPYRVNYNDPTEEDSRFGLDIVYPKLEKETSICSPYTVQPTEQKGERLKLSLPFEKAKKTIVLDLEGTLIKSSISYCTLPSYDFFVDFHDLPVSKYVLKRPGMDEFLSRLAKKYELIIFTESPRETTECILDRLDINHHITWRFYGDSCKSINGNFLVKDLSVLGKDLGSVLIIDDNPLCYSMQPRNAVAIKSFEGKMDDRELHKLLPFCDSLHNYRDVRTAILKNHNVVDY